MDGNGTLTRDELKLLFEKQGFLDLSDSQVNEIIDSIDSDHSGDISFNEFSDAFKLLVTQENHKNINELLFEISEEWVQLSHIDLGTDLNIQSSIHYAEHKHASTFLVAGGIGGIFSRTVTAPFERVKISGNNWVQMISTFVVYGSFDVKTTNLFQCREHFCNFGRLVKINRFWFTI